MMPPAILAGLPGDPAVNIQSDLGANLSPDGQLRTEAALPDFGSLLLLFAAEPGAEPSAGDDRALVKAENVSPSSDATPQGIEMLATIVLLHTQPSESLPDQKNQAQEFLPGLDISPAAGVAEATAAAQTPESSLVNMEGSDETTGFALPAPDFSPAEERETQIALPQVPAAAPENGKGIAELRPAGELPAKSQAAKEKPENLPHTVEPETAMPRDPAPVEKAGGEEKKIQANPGGKVFSAVSSPEKTDWPRDPEIFAPSALAVADSQVAARVEGVASLPSDRSGFFTRDNNSHAGANGSNERGDGNSRAALLTQPASLRAAESERPAAVHPAHDGWSATIERLAAEISTHARNHQQEISMRLEPPELGRLKIDLSLDGDRLQARVTAETAEAGNLIQTHVAELRQALQAHNLELVNVQVDSGGWAGLGGGLPQGARSESDQQRGWGEVAGTFQASDGEPQEQSRTSTVSSAGVSVWA